MNRNNYQLGSNDLILNERADALMNTIVFLGNERVYSKRFPTFSTIDYTDVEEQELIDNIIKLETVYAEAGRTHHKAHLYYLDETSTGYVVMHNDNEYASDGPSTSAPVCRGKTPIDALKKAWNSWSIPPVLILNADYYCPYVGIAEVVE